MTRSVVSILTPSFNQARWLADNLASVAAQDYPEVEHVVQDGASDDGSDDVVRKRGGPNVRWESEPDSGQSQALNRAFARSTGEIVGWLNSDDAFFSRDAISAAVTAFRRHPDADVVYGHAALVNTDGLLLQVTWAPQMWKRLLRVHNFLIQPAVFVRRAALGDVMVDTRFESMMDRELWLRLADRARFVRVNRILAIDRHQLDRKTSVRPDLYAADERLLRSLRPMPSGWWVRPVQKAAKVAFRFAGVTKVGEAMTTELAFEGQRDGTGRLVVRQLLTPRSRMPLVPTTERGAPEARSR